MMNSNHRMFAAARISVVTAFAALAACYSAAPDAGLPCSENLRCPDAQVCLPAGVCVYESGRRTLVHDSAADFSGGELRNVEISARGAVQTEAYFTHGLAVRALGRAAFVTPAGADFAALAAEAGVSTTIAPGASLSWGAGAAPPGHGLARGDALTLLLEGELYLEAGTWRLELRGDDAAFFELAAPGSTAYRRVLEHSTGGTALTTEAIAAAGWYPVRLAVANAAAAGTVQLLATPGLGAPAALDPVRLRSKIAASVRGALQESFVLPDQLRYVSGKHIAEVENVSFGTGAPADSGITGAGSYSVRFSGQFLVTNRLDGFTVISESGHRVWIDGALHADKMVGTIDSGATSELTELNLLPGWHDFVFDLDKRVTGSASLKIADPVGDSDAFSAQKLRPVVGPGVRWVGGNVGGREDIPAAPPTMLTRNVTLPAIAGTAHYTAIEYSIDHAALAEVVLALNRGTMQRTMAAAGSITGMGFARRRYRLDPVAFAGSPGGTWGFVVADAVNNTNLGTLENTSVASSYLATSPLSAPFPESATYTSAPVDLGEVLWIDGVTFALERAGVGDAELALRTAATEAELSAAPWIPHDRAAPAKLEPRRYLQYRVVLRNPQVPLALDRVELEYYTR